MTQQDDITQRVLTDDEIRDIITGTHQAFGEFKSGYMLVLGRAIESALLSKLRAPVADERISLLGAANLAFNALHECKPAKGAEKQYSDAIQALQSALHDIAYTVNRTATPQQFADHLQREARAALASAPVADERQAVAYLDLGTGGYMDMDTDLTDAELAALPKGRHMLAIIGTHGVNGYTPVSAPMADERAVETFAERFALALKPVAYTTKRGAVYLGKSTQVGSENLCTISQAVYEFRAALASAPVAVEQHDGLRTLLAELPGMHEDPKKGDAVFRCGVNGALNVVERRIRELLRSAPVAGEAIGYVDSLYLACRQRGLPCFGTIHHTPTSDATAPVYAAPQASAEDVRNAALDQAAAVAKRISDKYAFGHYGNETDTADEIEREILALKQPQADKDGCTCPSGDGSLRHPCPMHPGADKDGGQQRAGDGKTREAVDYPRGGALNFDDPAPAGPEGIRSPSNACMHRNECRAMLDRQQRAGDVDVDRLMAAAKGMTRLYSYVWDRTDGCLVVFPENVRAFDEAFDALRMATGEAVDDAPQAEQGEREDG